MACSQRWQRRGVQYFSVRGNRIEHAGAVSLWDVSSTSDGPSDRRHSPNLFQSLDNRRMDEWWSGLSLSHAPTEFCSTITTNERSESRAICSSEVQTLKLQVPQNSSKVQHLKLFLPPHRIAAYIWNEFTYLLSNMHTRWVKKQRTTYLMGPCQE